MYRVTFEQFDEDGSGKIDVGELQRALRGCGIECTADEVITMMSSVDESGDLEIDFDEFLQLIYNFRAEQEYASTSEESSDDEGRGDQDVTSGSAAGGGNSGFTSSQYAYGGTDNLIAYPPPDRSSLSFIGGKSSRRQSLSLGGDVSGVHSSENDPTAIHNRRIAAVTHCPEHNLRAFVHKIRTIREEIIKELSSMTSDSDDDRRISHTILRRLVSIKAPYVPSGSFMHAVRTAKEQQISSMLSASHRKSLVSTSESGGNSYSPPVAAPLPTPTQLIAFIDELLDAANERMISLVNMTFAYNSDDLYDGGNADDELLTKQQHELLKLVEAAAAVSGSGAKAAKKLSVAAPAEEDDSTDDDDSASPKNGTKDPASTENANTKVDAIANNTLENDTSPTPKKKADFHKAATEVVKKSSTDIKKRKKINAALDDLSSFTFALERTAEQCIGSDAFRAAAKKFPYFMFPIGSVCSVIDNLEKVHDAYDKALQGKEFLVKPRCKDGAKCKLLGILEHQLALSHPCYSETIPCPHRHRPLHMTCYHHDEDENPSAQATLLEMQKQLHILDLSGLEMGDTGAKCLSYVLNRDYALRGKSEHRIRHLKVCGNQISPEGAASLFENCGHLLTLDISNNGLGYKGSMLGGSAVGPSLQKLLTSETLVSLNLARNRLSDRDARYVTEALKDNTVLTTLDLQKNELGTLFGADLAAALQENRELKNLSVGWNRLESIGTVSLLNELVTMATIEYLDLSWTGVSDDGAQLLADMVAGSQLLRHLGLAHNNISGNGITLLKGSDSQKTLSKAIQGSRSLTHVDLSFNNLGTKATRDFLRDLCENLVLEAVDIRCVKASDDIAEDVKNYVKVRAGPGSLRPVVVQFGSSVTGMAGPTNPIKAEKMGVEKKPVPSQQQSVVAKRR